MAKKCICEICTCGNHACRHKTNLEDGLADIRRLIDNGFSYNSQQLVKARSEGELRQKRRQWETSPERLKEIYSAYAAGRDKENVTNESRTTSRRTSDSFYAGNEETRPSSKVALVGGRNPLQSITNADAIEELQPPKLAANSNAVKPGSPSSVKTALSDASKETFRTNKTYTVANAGMAGQHLHDHRPELPDNYQMKRSFDVGDQAAGVSSQSTLHAEFPEWKVTKPTKHRPHDCLKLEGILEDQTTTKADYGGGKLMGGLRSPVSIKPEGTWKPDEGEPTNYRTTIQEEYTPKKAEKMEQIKHQTAMRQLNNTMVVRPYIAETNAFNGQTTNKSDYREWSRTEKPEVKDCRAATMKQEGDMNLESSNRSEYVEVPMLVKTPLMRPKTTLQHVGHFDDRTVSKEAFRGMIVGEKQKSCKPVEKSHIVNEPLDSNTTIKTDYPNWHQKKPVIERPIDNLKVGGRTMEMSSVTGRDFVVSRNVAPERKGAPDSQLKNTGPTDYSTTNQNNYVRHVPSPVESVKSANIKRNESHWEMSSSKAAVMENTTVSKEEFTYRGTERPPPVVHKETLKMEGPMDLNTVSKLEYVDKPAEKVTVAKAPPTNIKMEGPMNSITSNRDDFKFVQSTRDKFYPKKKHFPFTLTDIREEMGNTRSYFVSGTDVKHDIKRQDDVDKIFSNDIPVESESVTRSEFKSWGNHKEAHLKPVTHLKFEGDSDYLTTTKEVFTNKNTPKLPTPKPTDHIPVVLDHGDLADFPRHREARKDKFETGRRSLPILESTNVAMEKYKQSYRPQTSVKPTGELDLTTTHQQSYSKTGEDLSLTQQLQRHKPSTNIKFEGPTNFVTTNKAEYAGKIGDKASLFRPPNSIKFEIPLDEPRMSLKTGDNKDKQISPKTKRKQGSVGKSTLQADFKAWDVSRNIAGKPPTHLRQEGRMELSSTMQSDFSGKTKGEKSRIFKPKTNLIFSGVHELKTTSRDDYKPILMLQDRRQPAGLVKKGEMDLQAVEIRGDRKLGERPEPLGSERLAVAVTSLGDQEDKARSRKSMYGQIWKQFEKYKAPDRNKSSIQNTGHVDFTTTTGSAFSRKNVATVRPNSKTSESHSPSPGKMSSRCSSKRNSITSQGSMKQHVSHLKMTGDMDFKTTNLASYAPSTNEYLLEVYKNQNAIKANAAKSTSALLFNGELPFCGKTTYNQHYTSNEPKRRPSCPAEKLESKFAFKEMVNGHQYYMPVVQS